MVIEIVFNNEIQIFFFSNQFIFSRKINKFVCIIEIILSLTFNLSFGQNFSKILKIKNDVLCNIIFNEIS
jgi:hypothetical protein